MKAMNASTGKQSKKLKPVKNQSISCRKRWYVSDKSLVCYDLNAAWLLLVDALKAFMAVAQGEVWRGNRALHLLYEDALETAGVKAPGERRDQRAGGGRTYAAWLYAYGLWFEDSDVESGLLLLVKIY